jgi:hypothetical protein
MDTIYRYRCYSGNTVTGNLGNLDSLEAEQVLIGPVGDWKSGPGLLQHRDALRTWRVFSNGEEETEVVTGYYRRVHPDVPAGRDICFYCGTDTTNVRTGFDCAVCGGN